MKTLTLMFIVLLLFLVVPNPAEAQDKTITLTWDAPTENTDGSLYDDPGGFKVYTHVGTDYIEIADVPHTQTTSTATMVGGEHCFVVTAYDDKTPANESAYSDELCMDLLAPIGGAVFNLRITIN